MDAGTASTALTEDDLNDVTSLSSCTPLAAGKRGYYFVAANGERFTTEVLVSRLQVVVGSFEPGGGAVGACGQSTGQGYLYHFKLTCGEGLTGQTGTESRSGRRAAAGGGGAELAAALGPAAGREFQDLPQYEPRGRAHRSARTVWLQR